MQLATTIIPQVITREVHTPLFYFVIEVCGTLYEGSEATNKKDAKMMVAITALQSLYNEHGKYPLLNTKNIEFIIYYALAPPMLLVQNSYKI